MNKSIATTVAVLALGAGGAVMSQGMILDLVANKVIAKYQGSTCEQLWAQKAQPKSAEEQRAVAFLKSDPEARAAFLNKVAGPVSNKMFECDMIP